MSNITHLICKKCEDFVFSFYRHDMNFCKCGACGLDGGLDYNKITGNLDDIIVVESDIETVIESIRDKFLWTKRYDKYNNLLKKPITKKLKKLTTDHIIGILLYFTKRISQDTFTVSKDWVIIHEIFLEELKYRKLK